MSEVKIINEIELISELVENGRLFDSDGYAVVKVTKDGREKRLKLPIKSTGVAEYTAELRGKAPRPPVARRAVKRDSAEGQALALTHDAVILVFDHTDEAYVNAIEKHTEWFGWKLAVFALSLGWKRADGSTAESFEERKKILQSNGITGAHIRQIREAVEDLTRIREESEDFLSAS